MLTLFELGNQNNLMRYGPLLISLLAAVILSGCAAGTQSVSYNAGIKSVERPADAQDRYGEYTITENDTTEGTQYIYEDDLVKAVWLFANSSMVMDIENKTDFSIQVRLNEGAFVLPDGGSSRIMTGDMSYAERNQDVQPIVVPSGASTSAILIPADNISFSEYSGVNISGIVQPTGRTAKQTEVQKNMGKNFSVLLPIEIQDTINEYTFTFEVNGAKIPSMQGKDQVIGDYPTGQ